MLETLNQIDTALFMFLNGFHSEYLDPSMKFISSTTGWIPFYAVLLFFLYKKFKIKVWIPLIAIALLILVSDQFASGLIKPLTKRDRPCFASAIADDVYCPEKPGGEYGFISSHAANTFAIAMFFWLVFRRDKENKWWVLFFWAGIVSYSRIYLGVHYPGDIIFGGLSGMLWAWLIYKILTKVPSLEKEL